MYEVFRFVEHGARCRQSLDCLEGTVLIYYLTAHPQIEKERLFDWFRQLRDAVEQYEKSCGGQNYKYLNPYSVIVSGDDKLMLLNLEAPENEFVMKKMQQRGIREHFVKPVLSRGISGDRTVDLFGFGKTIQFILAYAEPFPALTRREERRLSKMVGRCTGECGKKYENIRQISKDIPEITRFSVPIAEKRKIILAAGAVFAVGSMLFVMTAQKKQVQQNIAQAQEQTAIRQSDLQEEPQEELQEEAGDLRGAAGTGGSEMEQDKQEEDLELCVENTGDLLEFFLLENTTEGNETVLLFGKELELEAVRSLALAYEREEMTEEAILAYGRLLETEDQTERIETAAVKKMELEAEREQYAKAVLTGEEALERLEKSEEIEKHLEEYRAETAGEGDEDEK